MFLDLKFYLFRRHLKERLEKMFIACFPSLHLIPPPPPHSPPPKQISEDSLTSDWPTTHVWQLQRQCPTAKPHLHAWAVLTGGTAFEGRMALEASRP